ncbi:Neurotransmitter-gated ion-channel ligand binding domain protein [Ancylostoma ceylanicum]|uniref:Neurotransmitter-gated ion-channel ligand binding domain protein n=1 Tax=Ancylostoma ceylanicum TaxID=53326 RepID=A0A0D6LIY3_9BILA|nr:Neurotransmitter-gated ion-channel ligand binding domain protein [Ancylostoma ceylanicum]
MKVFLQQIVGLIWMDYRLSWDPEKYENVTSVRFAGGENQIWRPDVLLYNSANEDFDSTFKSNEVVYNTGEVNWVPPGILRASCKMDITYFPFDEQLCYLKIQQWTFLHTFRAENGICLRLRYFSLCCFFVTIVSEMTPATSESVPLLGMPVDLFHSPANSS